MITARNLVAGTELVALRMTAMYGWPVGDFSTESRSPRQNINVTVNDARSGFRDIIMHSNGQRTNYDKGSDIV